MFICPAPGCAARHPGTLRLLSDAGEHVNPSPYWHRLIAAGAVVVCDPPADRSPEQGEHPPAPTEPVPEQAGQTALPDAPHEDDLNPHEQELS